MQFDSKKMRSSKWVASRPRCWPFRFCNKFGWCLLVTDLFQGRWHLVGKPPRAKDGFLGRVKGFFDFQIFWPRISFSVQLRDFLQIEVMCGDFMVNIIGVLKDSWMLQGKFPYQQWKWKFGEVKLHKWNFQSQSAEWSQSLLGQWTPTKDWGCIYNIFIYM